MNIKKEKSTDLSGKNVVLVVLNGFVNDSRVLKEALSLQGAGAAVSVCAMHESGLSERENIQGLDVHRIRLRTRSWPKIKVVQIFKYIEFVARSVTRFRSTTIMHCNDLNALTVGAVLKVINRKAKVLYDAHEFEIHRTAKQSTLSIKANYYLEKTLIKFADAVTVTSQADADEYAKMYSIQTPKVVLNCPALTALPTQSDVFRKKFAIPKDRIVYLYQGSLHAARGIQVMLDAFAKIDDGSACIVFMGFGGIQDTVKDYANRFESIYFHDAVPPGELFLYTASADCGIIYMKNDCANHNYALPNKLFEYVMAEIPTITTPLQETGRVVNKYKLGFVSSGEDVASLHDIISSITHKDLDEVIPSLRVAKKKFTWENQEAVLLKAYGDMVA